MHNYLKLNQIIKIGKVMELDYQDEEQREEQREIFAELKNNVEQNADLSDEEKQQQISQLELEYAQLVERWRATDLQHEPGDDYIERDRSFFSD